MQIFIKNSKQLRGWLVYKRKQDEIERTQKETNDLSSPFYQRLSFVGYALEIPTEFLRSSCGVPSVGEGG